MTTARYTLRFPALDLTAVRRFYAEGGTPDKLVREIYRRIAERGNDAVWIYLPPLEGAVANLPTDTSLPLYGVPFAIKDNIDVAGWPTTAACPEYRYIPAQDATVVARLRALGAIPIGKTNLDQFATGLVGVRSPYGVPRSVYNGDYISGGSSSGSAVAVAAGLASFALGTDTAGSGRVPAAFNGLVGLKPTRGVLSAKGVVPACKSLDCVSIFTSNVSDAQALFDITRGEDAGDPFSRPVPRYSDAPGGTPRIGIPRESQWEFFGDGEARELYRQAVERVRTQGNPVVEIDFAPFVETAQLLYSGPWVAERLAAIESFYKAKPDALYPTTRNIIGGAKKISGVETFRGLEKLAMLRRITAAEWEKMDYLLLPTTGTTYRVSEVMEAPLKLNTTLGHYTNFANLLDLCAIAVPAGTRPSNQLPFGVTFFAPAFRDHSVCQIAGSFLGEPLPAAPAQGVTLAVAGAHLTGQPLNAQLTERGARLLRTCRTAAGYQLYALGGTRPPKPGLVRTPGFSGSGIEVELWSLSAAAFGDFTAQLPQPMVIGEVDLDDGTHCKGFLCEPCAVTADGTKEITSFGGWRAYLASL
ncbi:MAG: allophanate hydrolase [Chthoniobacteraceae bacterium]